MDDLYIASAADIEDEMKNICRETMADYRLIYQAQERIAKREGDYAWLKLQWTKQIARELSAMVIVK